MKRKSIIQRFKYLMAIFIIVFSQILPVYQHNAEANPADSNWLTYKFDEFSSDTFDQWFAVNGTAEVPSGANFIRLTPTVPEQSGAVFNKHGACPKNNYSFSTAFSFQMRNPSPEGASDGLTFTIQTGTTSPNSVGGGLGYYGIEPSFTVKYDTFQNPGYDPSANYVGLAENGSIVNKDGWYTDLDQYNTANGTSFVLTNGTLYYTWIDYDGINQNIQVRLGTSPDRTSANVILDVDDIDLDPIFDGEAYHAGFTASTGYPNYENHDINSWYFINDYAPIETLEPQNDYRQAPSSLSLTTEPANDGEYYVTVTLLDPLGNPVPGASPDALTATAGELTGPNGEPVTELVADADGKVHTVLKNADPSQDITVSATIGCDTDSVTIPTTGEPPTEPPTGSCPPPVALINGSFEEGPERGSYNASPIFFLEDEVPGWQTTDDSQGVKIIEIWNYEQSYPNGVRDFPAPPDGNRYAKLNAFDNGLLYQDVETTPRQTIYWRLSHMGRQGVDTMQVRIGPATDNPYDTITQTQMSTGNTAWATHTGTYIVPEGQTVTRFGFEAVSTAGGSLGAGNFLDDIFLGTEPCVVAEKSVSPEGEVLIGDELTYEVAIKNSGGDIAADVVFEDVIPEGTEYVPGSMKIISGPNAGDLTDEEDDDAGYFDGEKVIIQLGDLPNTTNMPDGIMVQFKVTALSSHAGESVINKATIGYRNLLTGEDEMIESNEVTTEIMEGEEIDACAAPVALVNGDFEKPEGPGTYDNSVAGGGYYYADTVPGWETTDIARTPRGIIQIMDPARPSTIPSNTPNRENLTSRFAELNADTHSMLYQELPTVPGQTIYWRIDHRGYNGVDTMSVNIGPVTADPFNTTPELERISTGTTWETYSGSYTVPAGQTVTRFGFKAISSSTGALAFGNYIDNVFLGTEPCVTAEKTVSPEGEVSVGDELTYEVTIKNNGGDIAADVAFEDVIPEGTEYVPSSMKILTGPNAGDLTDADDNDAGHFDGDKVIINLGNLPNTTELPDGITVQFKVRTISDNGGEPVVNKATVDYKNLLTNEDESTESNEVETPVQYNSPQTESEKSATLLEKAVGNTDDDHPEVGDTLRYTIQTRNTVEDSLIANLTIRDVIPAGLEYVPGTLRVDGEAVTDEDDGDQGYVVGGEVFASFGDIIDTEWHTLEFHVIVAAGQAGNDIENIAIVDGDNLDEPDEPREEVKIYPREPRLESEKSAQNADETKARYEVGDTVVYTIRARNTVSDSLLENLRISDELPEGLAYVEGSLEVSHGGIGSYEDGTITAVFAEVTDTEWRTVTFEATIESGQEGETIRNVATVDGDNVVEPTSPTTEITIEPKEPTDPGDGTIPTDPGNDTDPTDPGDGTTPTDPGNDTDPTDPGDGTTPTDPGNDTDPTDPGDGTTPTDPRNDTDPTDPGNGTTPTDSENGTTPTDPGNDTDLTDTGLNTTPTDSGNGTTPTEPGHKLPNTATNLYNLGFIGMMILLLGLLLRRKSKVF